MVRWPRARVWRSPWLRVLVDVGPGLGESGVPVVEECVGAEAGGVFAGGEGDGGDGYVRLVGLVDYSLLGGLAGGVCVECGGEVVGAGGEYAVEVAVGEGGSAGGDDVGESGLVGGDGVGVAFDYSGCSAGADPVGGFVDSVEGVGFVVEGCGAGVEVFGGVGVLWELRPAKAMTFPLWSLMGKTIRRRSWS